MLRHLKETWIMYREIRAKGGPLGAAIQVAWWWTA